MMDSGLEAVNDELFLEGGAELLHALEFLQCHFPLVSPSFQEEKRVGEMKFRRLWIFLQPVLVHSVQDYKQTDLLFIL